VDKFRQVFELSFKLALIQKRGFGRGHAFRAINPIYTPAVNEVVDKMRDKFDATNLIPETR
jgi:hypothetical protein